MELWYHIETGNCKSKPMSKYLQVCYSINSLDIIVCAVPEISEIQNGGINNSTVARFKEFEDFYVCNSWML